MRAARPILQGALAVLEIHRLPSRSVAAVTAELTTPTAPRVGQVVAGRTVTAVPLYVLAALAQATKASRAVAVTMMDFLMVRREAVEALPLSVQPHLAQPVALAVLALVTALQARQLITAVVVAVTVAQHPARVERVAAAPDQQGQA